MVIAALAPDQFPHVRAERTRATFRSKVEETRRSFA
jgi:hypothetical protein